MSLNLQVNNDKIEQSFERIANDLMNKYFIQINDSRYRITEIEFYVKGEDHDDKYTHGHKLQKESGRWYFHGSGVDITFGNSKMFGGILIRAIYNCNTKINESERYVYGPLNVITELFSNLKEISKGSFDFGILESNFFKFERLIKAPRVGLNPQKQPEKYSELYRYLIMPKRKHADKTKIAASMRDQDIDEEIIKKIWA